VLTHGGFGYAKEYHVDRLLRRVTLTRIAPRKLLDLPKSY
jgi:acyl-CoA dehydrogenase